MNSASVNTARGVIPPGPHSAALQPQAPAASAGAENKNDGVVAPDEPEETLSERIRRQCVSRAELQQDMARTQAEMAAVRARSPELGEQMQQVSLAVRLEAFRQYRDAALQQAERIARSTLEAAGPAAHEPDPEQEEEQAAGPLEEFRFHVHGAVEQARTLAAVVHVAQLENEAHDPVVESPAARQLREMSPELRHLLELDAKANNLYTVIKSLTRSIEDDLDAAAVLLPATGYPLQAGADASPVSPRLTALSAQWHSQSQKMVAADARYERLLERLDPIENNRLNAFYAAHGGQDHLLNADVSPLDSAVTGMAGFAGLGGKEKAVVYCAVERRTLANAMTRTRHERLDLQIRQILQVQDHPANGEHKD